ncbi:diaminopropionate ammonia-lyase [Truncatella angustata]|uniref:Diaminopropionate ammonia-lyase n=1 Tax=Truncatella angustata TaxID=152316 RepID=A0A9P8RJX8_9PEZI|nr:diaminopropionate ammonia-lyase [Truncatella angustata]KAH6639986.1 diaminopropionate ammonia-lyase [Truncatella angustata]
MSARRQPFIRDVPSKGGLVPFDTIAVTSFHESLPGYRSSPLIELRDIAKELGLKAVFLKDESNRFGLPSFKILGASWGAFTAITTRLVLPLDSAVDQVASEASKAELVLFAATDGNHGRAVAYMAKLLSIDARIYVSRSLDEYTKQAIRGEGAQVIVVAGDYDDAVRSAAQTAGSHPGGVLVQDTSFPSYEETPARIVEGYSTIFREADRQLAELGLGCDVVFSPVGVGSLAHAMLRHHKSRERSQPTKVVAVEPDTAACLYRSLQSKSGGPSPKIRTSHTIMTGLDCGTVSYTAWPDLRSYIDTSVTVSDFEAHNTVQELQARGIESGPCGASGLAALRYLAQHHRESLGFNDQTVVVLFNTEGNRPYHVPHDVSSDDPVILTQILTQIESTNPTLSVSRGSGEGAIADYMEAWLQHRDIESHRHELVKGRPSIIGVVQGTGSGRSLMLNAHTDTVSLAAYTTDPLSGNLTEKNGLPAVVGRGSLDMKAGLAAAMVALSNAKKRRVHGTVLLAAVADEEDSSRGTSEILAAGWRADGAVGTGHKGFLWVEVEITGVAAHGSRADVGVDAILNAGSFLNSFKTYAADLPTDDFLGQASAHCGLVEGGEELSSYPASCRVKIEFRTIPGQRSEGILQDITAMLEELATSDQMFTYKKPNLLLERPAFKLSSDNTFANAAMSAASEALSRPVNPQGLSFWCDAALLNEAGIPSVVFGPKGEGLHAKEEWVDAESIKTTTVMLDALIADFCNQ